MSTPKNPLRESSPTEFLRSAAVLHDGQRVLNVDAGVFAQITENWKAQLNIENIFNKGYWASADGNNNLSPGQPQTYRLKVTAKL